MKKIIKYVLLTSGIVILLGGFYFIQKEYLININENVKKEKATELSQFDSPYTFIEKYKEGKYELYIYASAVQWKDGDIYKKIDNSIVFSEKKIIIMRMQAMQ